MNSEAKVLVPGIPGHHAPIRPPPPQTKEVENKRKSGSNEVTQPLTRNSSLRFKNAWESITSSEPKLNFQKLAEIAAVALFPAQLT
jgi:hypothetical protein